ncbi:MAG TPA: pilus assembly protein N-terminal domain-containing protein [Candidatus Krumholzibacteria bacterium]
MSRPTPNIRTIALLALGWIVMSVPALAAVPQINVIVGQSVTYKHTAEVKTVSISDSDVADVVVAGPKEVLLNGKKIGLTTLVIWDENNVSHMFNVTVRGAFSDQKIELRVKLAEVNRTKAMELGVDMLGKHDEFTGATYPGGGIAPPGIPLPIFNNYFVEGVTSAFRWVDGTDEIQVMIHALESNGVLKVLAEPNVIAASGQEATFLSGGELPVPIASAGTSGGTTVTIEWKEFGVKVRFVPTIVDTGVINLVVAPEVSSLDYGNAIQISGFNIPAIRSRKAETTVELSDKETLVIGGLIMEEEQEVRVRLPILGHIPILGYLFSDTRKQKTTNELMIVVSPHLVRSLPAGAQVKLPTDEVEKN